MAIASTQAEAQVKSTEADRKVLQFSGVVVANDSLDPIPFVNVMLKGSRRGTISDFYGYYSFVAQEKDTVEFTAVGYKKGTYVIPSDLPEHKYSLIHLLQKDTITLKEAVIYQWPTKEQFRQAFLNLNVDDPESMRAARNLEMIESKGKYVQLNNDPSMAYKQQMQNQYTKMYYAGRVPTTNWLNPVAWSEFIKSWKHESKK